MSHEIRTPLNGILGMSQLLADTALTPTQENYRRAIATSGNTLLGLVEDVLDTALVDAGKMELHPAPYNLHDLVAEVCELLATRNSALPLQYFIAPDVPARLEFDKKRLRQVLINLVGNALKFTKTGGVGLFVERLIDPETDSNCLLRIRVVDSGPGLQARDRERIFSAFEQAAIGAGNRQNGAGLGLSIAQRIIQLMGGEVGVESTPGEGSNFHVTLPLALPEPEASEDTTLALKSSPTRNVALVMPQSPSRTALQDLLMAHGLICTLYDSTSQLLADPDAAPEVVLLSMLPADERPGPVDDVEQKALRTRFGPETKVHTLHPIGFRANRSSNGLPEKGFDGWLTWPVRTSALQRVLTGKSDESRFLPANTTQVPDNKARRVVDTPSLTMPEPAKQVLLAEDNAINALLAKSLLTKLGYGVTHVENGRDAIAAASEMQFSHILMDRHMPSPDNDAALDGLDAIAAIRDGEMHKGRPHCPITLLTADAGPDVETLARQAGATHVVLKPLDLDAVATLLDDESPSAVDVKATQKAV